MPILITVERRFEKALTKLPPHRRKQAAETLVKFQKDPANKSVRFHPLRGHEDHFILCSAHGDRIILRLNEPDHYSAVDVGPHDLYRRWDRR